MAKVLLLIFVITALTACNQNSDKQDNSAAEKPAAVSDNSAQPTAINAIPQDFPADIYLPGDYQVTNTLNVKADGANREMLSVDIRTNASAQNAINALKDNMVKSGWKEEFSSDNPVQSMLIFERKPQAVMIFVARIDDQQSSISYQYIPDSGKQ